MSELITISINKDFTKFYKFINNKLNFKNIK